MRQYSFSRPGGFAVQDNDSIEVKSERVKERNFQYELDDAWSSYEQCDGEMDEKVLTALEEYYNLVSAQNQRKTILGKATRARFLCESHPTTHE